jgi:hypothetical protein
MSFEDLQQLLTGISAQTGRPTPSVEEIQSFLRTPGSQRLLQALLGTQSTTLTAAASSARSGDFEQASNLLRTYLNSAEGQEWIRRLAENGGTK